MARESVRPNININKLYMKLENWSGTTISIPLERDEAIKLSRELLEAAEKISNPETLIEITIFPKRKTPTLTVSWVEKE